MAEFLFASENMGLSYIQQNKKDPSELDKFLPEPSIFILPNSRVAI